MDPGMVRKAGGAHCTEAASGAAGGRAGLSAGHFLVQGHYTSVGEKFIKLDNDDWKWVVYSKSPPVDHH